MSATQNAVFARGLCTECRGQRWMLHWTWCSRRVADYTQCG